VSIHPRYLREQVREARGMPAKGSIVQAAEFLRVGRRRQPGH
jgi:hypothetical protein